MAKTVKECQTILFNIGIKLGVSPKLISERLLSLKDKNDMLEGKISRVELEAITEVWRDNGMPDYAHGLTKSFESEKNNIKMSDIYKGKDSGKVYNKPFIEYRISKEELKVEVV